MAAYIQSASNLTISVDDLLKVQGVEKQRVEFKKTWRNDRDQPEGTYWQVLHTICAFANDIYNDNGGYIIVGVEEDNAKKRQALLPPCGISEADMGSIQEQIVKACKVHIKPDVHPIISPEIVGEKHILVIWMTASDSGPHQCREKDEGSSSYYIRQGTDTKKASAEETAGMLQQSNKTPFDDRMAKNHG